MLLSAAWKSYESDKRLEGYSQHTLKSYRLQSNLLIRRLGDIGIDDITFEQLKNHLAMDAVRLKPSSIGHRVRFLKSLCRWAMDEGHISKNPAAKLKEPKQGHRIPKALSEEDIEMLREGCKTPLEHALVEMLYTTGCRVGEIATLNRNAVSWEDRSMIVRGKGRGDGKDREVYFTIKCGIWLKQYLKSRKDSDIAMFVTERAPHRMGIAQIRYIIKRIAKRAGIDANVYPHILRHTYATHLLNNGMALEVIQTLLGHEKLDTTRVYAHLSGQHRRDAYRKHF